MTDFGTAELESNRAKQALPDKETPSQVPTFIDQVIDVFKAQSKSPPGLSDDLTGRLDRSVVLLEQYQKSLAQTVQEYVDKVKKGRIKNPNIEAYLSALITQDRSIKTDVGLLSQYGDGGEITPQLSQFSDDDYNLKIQILSALDMLPSGVTPPNLDQYLTDNCETIEDVQPGEQVERIREKAEQFLTLQLGRFIRDQA